MPKNKAINLLPQEEFNISTTGRILKWATGTFRIIVIITEMVVMGAFLSRFWLDAENSNLKDSIKIKTAQVAAQADLEKKFRDIQSKLNIFGQIAGSQNTSKRIEQIVSVLPPDIALSGVSVSDDSTQVKGTSPSDIEIAQFVANLQADKTIKNVDLEQVSSSENGSAGTVFSIIISY
jgi:Tfp pilus assembly protein PilN